MVDPAFLRRLENWSRVISGRSQPNQKIQSNAAQICGAMLYDTSAPRAVSNDTGNARARTPVDLRDADLLSRAYVSPHLSTGARKLLALKYGERLSDAACARKFGCSYRRFCADHDLVVEYFAKIVAEEEARSEKV